MSKIIAALTQHAPIAVQALAFGALAATSSLAQDGPRVVAVNYPLTHFAARLLGDEGEAVFPVPADQDPSFWRPAISDISAIQSADLIVLNGAGFAGWIDRVSLPRSKVVNSSAAFSERYIATQSITHSHGDGGTHSHEGIASYLWLDPALAALQAEAVASALVARGLVPEDTAAARLSALQADLDALDQAARTALAGLQGQVLIATHPRYHYLARAYDLRIEALEWEAGATPTAAELEALQALAAETGARVLIWEAAPAPEALEAVARLGLRSVIFPPLARAPAEGGFADLLEASILDLAQVAAVP